MGSLQRNILRNKGVGNQSNKHGSSKHSSYMPKKTVHEENPIPAFLLGRMAKKK